MTEDAEQIEQDRHDILMALQSDHADAIAQELGYDGAIALMARYTFPPNTSIH